MQIIKKWGRKRKNIHILKNNINIQNILNNFLADKYINNKDIDLFANILNKFGQYFFIKEKVFLISNMYTNINSCENTSSVHLIVCDKPIIINDKEANILFFIIANNKTEHLQMVSQIMKIAEDDILINDIINQKSSENIILVIEKYYNK